MTNAYASRTAAASNVVAMAAEAAVVVALNSKSVWERSVPVLALTSVGSAMTVGLPAVVCSASLDSQTRVKGVATGEADAKAPVGPKGRVALTTVTGAVRAWVLRPLVTRSGLVLRARMPLFFQA